MSTGPTVDPAAAICAACGAAGLLPVRAGAELNHLCVTCGACWHRTPVGLERVVPETCPGCAYRGMCVRPPAALPLHAVVGPADPFDLPLEGV